MEWLGVATVRDGEREATRWSPPLATETTLAKNCNKLVLLNWQASDGWVLRLPPRDIGEERQSPVSD